jgi:ElaB/YqjD/DUF883 family membrane-anchored ribosome-binding protein
MSAPLGMVSARNGAGRAKNAVASPFDELFDGVDDLIKRVADVESPEVRKIRAKVHAALVAAKSALAAKNDLKDSTNQIGRQVVQVADGTDDYWDEEPERSLGLALLVGVGLGLVVSLRQ